MKRLHLICNAHIDPIWLWEWEEGASAALSTFRSAANLADEFDYIFCHNEVTLYKWVEEYDPALFERIRVLVHAGKWKIIGGWYLQPDCNMPSGESFVRQIREGNNYFREKFGVKPTTAVNFDPFGHTVGLVQILKKCGYDSYLCCRPSPAELDIPDDCVWEGLDGSRVELKRASGHYNSGLGFATEKIVSEAKRSHADIDLVLWGVGNHGGGPSRKDLQDIEKLMRESEFEIVHSTPEAYFADRGNAADSFIWRKGINFCMPGCYTSMIRVKQLHSEMENQLFMTEKMLSHAAMLGLLEYPHAELAEAIYDLLNAEFHDVLPGTAIKPACDYGVRVLHHGLEILNRLRAKAFFALSSGQACAAKGEFPVLVYNPHPYPVKTVVDVGFNLEDQNYDDSKFTDIVAYAGEKRLNTQLVKEKSNLNLDWMKRARFACELQPSSINRFDLKKHVVSSRKQYKQLRGEAYIFEGSQFSACVNLKTGLIDSITVGEKEYIGSGLGRLTVETDNEDPWAMAPAQLKRLGTEVGEFRLMKPSEGSRFSGIFDKTIPSVRMIEDGEIYTEIEAVFAYGRSAARIGYIFYKYERKIDISVTLFMGEKNGIVRLHIPPAMTGETRAQIAFGYENVECSDAERVMHRWVVREDKEKALAVINNGLYGFRNAESGFALNLVRGAAYSAHPIRDRRITPADRFVPRMDQEEQNYTFRLLFGCKEEVNGELETETAVFNQAPFALCVFPSGEGKPVVSSALRLSNREITLCAFKQAADGEGYIVRLQNNSFRGKNTHFDCPPVGIECDLVFGPFEVKTLRLMKGKVEELKTLEI